MEELVAMTPNEIKAELVLRGIAVTKLAKEIKVAVPSVSQNISGVRATRHIQEHIAKRIERSWEQVFPVTKVQS